jgi:hypothetical protein
MGVRGARAGHSIRFLKYLKANNYIAKDGTEYDQEEIDLELVIKESRAASRRPASDSIRHLAALKAWETRRGGIA